MEKLKEAVQRITVAFKLFAWGFKSPQVMQLSVFKMMSDLLTVMWKVALEHKPYVSKIASINFDTGKEIELLTVWIGYGIDSSPFKRNAELIEENRQLKIKLSASLDKSYIATNPQKEGGEGE